MDAKVKSIAKLILTQSMTQKQIEDLLIAFGNSVKESQQSQPKEQTDVKLDYQDPSGK